MNTKSNRYNQRRLAAKSGYSESFLSQLLSGDRNLKYPDALDFAILTRTKPELWLQGGAQPGQRRKAVGLEKKAA